MTAPASSSVPHALPLYVDLDGTLIATDLLHESFLKLVRTSAADLWRVPGWLLRGKAVLKQEIAARIHLDVATLPYRQEVLALLRAAREEGRRTVLATASDLKYAEQIALHLGLFDHVLASDGTNNLSGSRKLDAIRSDANNGAFVYAGDRPVDLAIWRHAAGAVVVTRATSLRRKVGELVAQVTEVRPPLAGLRRYLYGMRLHQWLKNLLVFLPLLPVLHGVGMATLGNAVLAFVAFGLMASGVYVVNDLLDLELDRRHHRKRLRPFAAGEIPIHTGVGMAAALFTASILLSALCLPLNFLLVLGAYFVLTTAYSLRLKRHPVFDVFALAGLYTVRIVAGAAATGLPLSFWILSFSLFIFLSLALAKRYAELSGPDAVAGQRVGGRGYMPSDLPYVLASGITAGQMSVLLLSLYLHDRDIVQRYQHADYLWVLIPLLLFWVSRVWFKAVRHELHDDPVVFAVKDRMSRLVVLCMATAVWVSA